MVHLLLLGIPIKGNDKAPRISQQHPGTISCVSLPRVTESCASFLMTEILCHQGVNLNPGLLWGREAIRMRAPREGLWRTVWGGVAMVGKHCSGVLVVLEHGGPVVEGTDSRLGMGRPGVLTEALSLAHCGVSGKAPALSRPEGLACLHHEAKSGQWERDAR